MYRSNHDSSMRFCPYCGSPLQPGGRFCGKCGKNIESVWGAATPPPVRPKSSAPQGLLAIAIVLILIVVAWPYIIRGIGGNTPIVNPVTPTPRSAAQPVITVRVTTAPTATPTPRPTATPTPRPTATPTPRRTATPTPRRTATPRPTQRSAYPIGQTCTITGQYVSLRSGAGVKYTKLGTVYGGNTYHVKDVRTAVNGQTWYQITSGGKTGWVHAAFASVGGRTVNVNTNGRTDSITDANGIVGSRLYVDTQFAVRAKAGASFNLLGQVQPGESYSVLDIDTSDTGKIWFKIRFGSGTGWVSATCGTVNGLEY